MLSTLCSRLGGSSGSGSGPIRHGAGRSGGRLEGEENSSSPPSSSALAKPMAVLLAWNYGAAALTLPQLASAAMAAMT